MATEQRDPIELLSTVSVKEKKIDASIYEKAKTQVSQQLDSVIGVGFATKLKQFTEADFKTLGDMVFFYKGLISGLNDTRTKEDGKVRRDVALEIVNDGQFQTKLVELYSKMTPEAINALCSAEPTIETKVRPIATESAKSFAAIAKRLPATELIIAAPPKASVKFTPYTLRTIVDVFPDDHKKIISVRKWTSKNLERYLNVPVTAYSPNYDGANYYWSDPDKPNSYYPSAVATEPFISGLNFRNNFVVKLEKNKFMIITPYSNEAGTVLRLHVKSEGTPIKYIVTGADKMDRVPERMLIPDPMSEGRYFFNVKQGPNFLNDNRWTPIGDEELNAIFETHFEKFVI